MPRITACLERAAKLNAALLDTLSRKSSRKRWHTHRATAKWRGIPFELTFEQWEAWWTATGHFDDRGKQRGQWVMARKGDCGAYSLNNIECIQAQQNVIDNNKTRLRDRVRSTY